MNEKSLRYLIEAFLNGDSTPEQEQVLYRYFTSGNISPEFEQYRPMFAWYASLPQSANVDKTASNRMRRFLRVAAAITVLCAVGIFAAIGYSNSGVADDDLYAQYRGSYVYSGGKKITNIESIYPSIAAAEAYVDSIDRLAEPLVPDFDEIIVDEALVDIADPDVAAEVRNNILG